MSRLNRLITKTPNYVRRFGVIAGGRLVLTVERALPERSSEIRS